MNGHDADTVARSGRTDLGVVFRPGFQEAGEIIAVHAYPILKIIHKRQDIRHFPIYGNAGTVKYRAKQVLCQRRKGIIRGRHPDSLRPGVVSLDADPEIPFLIRIGRVVRQRQGRHRQAHQRRRLDLERIVRYDRDSFGNQPFCDKRSVRVPPDQDGDVPVFRSFVQEGADGGHDFVHLFIHILPEDNLDTAGGFIFQARLLPNRVVEGVQAELTGGEAEESVLRLLLPATVEVNDFGKRPVISLEGIGHVVRKFRRKPVCQEPPVGAPEPIDRLFDVTYDEVFESAGLAVGDQRAEVVPLHGRCILELVQKEILVADAQFLVDERGVGTVDDIAQNGIGVIDAEDILLFEEEGELLLELPGDPEAVDLPPQDESRIIGLEPLSEKIAEIRESRG